VVATLTWSASDPGSGVVNYNIQHRSGNGSWHNVILRDRTATHATFFLRPDRAHLFRVRARDKAGNLSSFVAAPKIQPLVVQSSSATLLGTWKAAPDAKASGGGTRYSTEQGAKASLAFSGRAIGVVVQRGPGRGLADILVDGKKVATIDLQAAALQERRVVYATRWSSIGNHTVSVVVTGTKGRPRVDVDAFVVLR
jgi:hypothetical protein